MCFCQVRGPFPGCSSDGRRIWMMQSRYSYRLYERSTELANLENGLFSSRSVSGVNPTDDNAAVYRVAWVG